MLSNCSRWIFPPHYSQDPLRPYGMGKQEINHRERGVRRCHTWQSQTKQRCVSFPAMQQLCGCRRKPSSLFAPPARGKPRVLFSRSHPAPVVPITCWPYIPRLLSQRLSSAACQVVGSRCRPLQTGSPNPPAFVPPRWARLRLCSGAKPPLQRILLPPPSA